jgi:hypothetical protein
LPAPLFGFMTKKRPFCSFKQFRATGLLPNRIDF